MSNVPTVFRRFNEAGSSSCDAVVRDLYSKAQRRLTELVPAVPLYENHTIIAYHRYVHGVVHDTSHNTPFLACVWFDQNH
jgi:peptide/nickel transport system substrate-binding protein